jgi:two-component system response regulator MprA
MYPQKSTELQRILIADDDPVIRLLIRSIVEKEGYKAVVVNDGREADRILKVDAKFSAVILDMMMPHVEGVKVIRSMRTEERLMSIPVMMITADKDIQLMANSFAAGATVFLPKPFTTEQFQTTFRMLLRHAAK